MKSWAPASTKPASLSIQATCRRMQLSGDVQLNQAFVDLIRSQGGNNAHRFARGHYNTDITRTIDDRQDAYRYGPGQTASLCALLHLELLRYRWCESMGNRTGVPDQNQLLEKMTKFTREAMGHFWYMGFCPKRRVTEQHRGLLNELP